jgi:predicted nucleic acid-binding protein
MKAVLDACVIYPTVLREILLGVAQAGLYEPLWSDRILEEWTRATAKLGPVAQMEAQSEATLLRANFPRGQIRAQPDIEARLLLPDENDLHVLAIAIAGHADCIVTLNAKDFPRHLLAEEGLERRDPDGLLWQLHSFHPEKVAQVVARVHAKAEVMAGQPLPLKSLLKRAQLPKLAKALLA